MITGEAIDGAPGSFPPDLDIQRILGLEAAGRLDEAEIEYG